MSLIDEAEKVAGTAATAGASAFLPQILTVIGVVVALLISVIAADHFIWMPSIRNQRDAALNATAAANLETKSANATIGSLRQQITDQNQAVEVCRSESKAKADAAVADAVATLHKPRAPLPPPPAGQSAAEINAYWSDMQKVGR